MLSKFLLSFFKLLIIILLVCVAYLNLKLYYGPEFVDDSHNIDVVGQRAAALNNRPARFVELRNALEAFGMAYTSSGKKRFVFGQLTVADAFIAWSNAAEQREAQFKTGWWQWQFQLYSFMLIVVLVWLFRKL